MLSFKYFFSKTELKILSISNYALHNTKEKIHGKMHSNILKICREKFLMQVLPLETVVPVKLSNLSKL